MYLGRETTAGTDHVCENVWVQHLRSKTAHGAPACTKLCWMCHCPLQDVWLTPHSCIPAASSEDAGALDKQCPLCTHSVVAPQQVCRPESTTVSMLDAASRSAAQHPCPPRPPHLSDENRCSVSARASSLLSLLEEPSGDRVGPSSCSSAHARSSSLEARSSASVSC
jgi:hypothetical protein